MHPPFLQPGSKVALVAPARRITPEEISFACKVLEEWGLVPVLDERLFKVDNQFGGTDKERLELLQEMLDNPEIGALLAVRGGYGTTRIIDDLDFTQFIKAPKWICGYSDITALLCHAQNLNIESLHCSMPMLFHRDLPDSLDSIRKNLFGESYPLEGSFHSLNREGVAEGKIVGGNLSILNTLIGTASDVNTDGLILFMEDIDEYLYNIDRMIVQLKRAGKLKKLAGLIVGHMTDMKDNLVPFGRTAYEIISEHTRDFAFPIAFGLPIGHEPHNIAVPCGKVSRLSVNESGSRLEFLSL